MNLQRNRVQIAKDKFFIPIKEELKTELGENYSNYFLSNRKMVEYVTGEQVLLSYQRVMIEHIAKKLGLVLPGFMSG
ncbi:hypothetical protein ERX46_00985 [Brumimicrobium glaciale]|uniref:Uncharacterized protein n=1 Tax=Brumimicrobium glaciale TaxID=200475 RepID=A0A4Q4KU05_9FLAO|nr:hypothetical protein [Brumimicrobium glaciale]RYM35594.1 hypothetical protein ERX46_00985 [Brumimicrobium glaciale]